MIKTPNFIRKYLFKKRQNLYYIGTFGGHDWYRAHKFDHNITGRYLAFNEIIQNKDKFGMQSHELDFVLSEALDCLKKNDIVGATQMLTAAQTYKELEDSNDWVFKMVNQFLIIDNEPLEETTEHYTLLKAKAYKDYPSVKVFFCEVYNTLMTTSKDLTKDFSLVEYLNSRLVQVSELMFSNALKRENLL